MVGVRADRHPAVFGQARAGLDGQRDVGSRRSSPRLAKVLDSERLLVIADDALRDRQIAGAEAKRAPKSC